MKKSLLSFISVVIAIIALAGCRAPSPPPKIATVPPPAAALPRLSALDARRLKANELGYIPILMYHSIGERNGHGPMPRDRRGLNIAPATFRKHLAMMYRAGWYPVNMRDVLSARMDVPAGKTPVVLTFDDARGSQFRYRKDGSLDPDCAVGILETFSAAHPDWPRRAVFYILPASAWNPVPFWQRGREAQKLRFLARQGYEIANHSTTHRSMARMDGKTLRREMAGCVRYLGKVLPGVEMDTMALPYGATPRRAVRDCLLSGSFAGVAYHNRCILLAWGGPSRPPAHKRFDPRAIVRIGAEPGNIEAWIRRLRRGGRYSPYVSDGDPQTVSFPAARAKWLNPRRLVGLRLLAYGDPPKLRIAGKSGSANARRNLHGKSRLPAS